MSANRLIFSLVGTGAALAVLSALQWTSAQTLPQNRLPVLEDCQLSGPPGVPPVAAQCGWLPVPEDPDRPDAGEIELFVARVPALDLNPQPDPLTVIAGGPGGASTEFYVGFRAAFERIQRERDILLVDQRGTGGSNPLQCPEQQDLEEIEFDLALVTTVTRDCLAEMPSDPAFYTTSVAVGDLDRVRAAFGYEQINVYGASYGTRVAQHYLRRFPDQTRTVIVDGVVPVDHALGADIAVNAQSALDAIFDRCAATPDCDAAFPAVGEDFQTLRAKLRSEPVWVTLANPITGAIERIKFTEFHLSLAVRLLSYNAAGVSLLPLMLHQAVHQANLVPLAAQAAMVAKNLSDGLSYGMHNAVVCTEDVPFLDPGSVDRAALEQTYLGTAQLDGLVEICKVWPAGRIDADFKQPFEAVAPVLLLSGSADPVTPPSYAAQAATGLGALAHHVVVPGHGHGVAATGCLPKLLGEFVAAASTEGLDWSCLELQGAAPFFVGFSGPLP